MEVYIGMIFLFAGNFAPLNFMPCDGRLLSVSQYSALYSILGTFFGGNGTSNFALPDLRGRFPIGAGNSVYGSIFRLGEVGGNQSVTLLQNNMPLHSHTLNAYQAAGNKDLPGNTHVLAGGSTSTAPVSPVFTYSTNPPNAQLLPASIGNAGGNQPFPIMPPYQGLTYIIAVAGLFPSRN